MLLQAKDENVCAAFRSPPELAWWHTHLSKLSKVAYTAVIALLKRLRQESYNFQVCAI